MTAPAPEEVDVTSRVIPILATIANGLASSLSTEVGRVVVSPGTAEADDDCCDGQLHVRLARVMPRYTGRPGVDKACTLIDWELTVMAGVTRCAAVLDEHGNAPSADAVSQDAFNAVQDMHEILTWLTCTDIPLVTNVILDEWRPKGPQGGCHGGEWQFRLHVSTTRKAPS